MIRRSIGLKTTRRWSRPRSVSFSSGVCRTAAGFDRTGFAINLAKRIESVSREGEHFRIMISDPAFKLVNRRVRHLLFGPRRLVALKGVADEVGVTERHAQTSLAIALSRRHAT